MAYPRPDTDPKNIWQDREIHFDLPLSLLKPRRNEVEIDSINSVEDTRGNNGDKGMMSITNLRMIWLSHKNKKVNLTIGFGCIVNISVRPSKSKMKGGTQSLHIITKVPRFAFEFTSLVNNSPRLFTTIQVVLRSYESTKLYRNLKLRGAIVKNAQLIQLPDEEVFSKVDGVWNLSSDQGNLGTFFISNVRVVWHAKLAETFNVSIPYMQIQSIKVRDSKFGQALVIETRQKSGGYVLGFRVDPADRLNGIFTEISRLFETFSVAPVFGVKWNHESSSQEEKFVIPDDTEIISDSNHFDTLAAYYVDGGNEGSTEPVYDPTIGLAVQPLREGATLESLWRVR